MSSRACSPQNSTRVMSCHRLNNKAPYQILRRNERERKRVNQINEGYQLLSRTVPSSPTRKLSKLETLREAVRYIRHLQGMLQQGEVRFNMPSMEPMEEPTPCNQLPSLNDTRLFHHEYHDPSYHNQQQIHLQYSPSFDSYRSCFTY